jgi:hypothetical protein
MNRLAIIIAFYLSKFDKIGLQNLGFKTDSEAFESIATSLGIKKNYIKFRRDEFDPVHPWRKGWQRPMDNRIIRAIEALQDLSEPDLREIVQKILSDAKYRNSEEINRITSLFVNESKEKNNRGKFILRGPTGKQAEEFFINYYSQNKKPIEGKLIDSRELGIGYDFRIEAKQHFFIEVKGLSDIAGGILFTNKEWITAKEKGVQYYLCIVSDIGNFPQIKFIQDPSNKLNPAKNIYPTIQISWSVTQKQLAELNDYC